jgi:hypothetical protein
VYDNRDKAVAKKVADYLETRRWKVHFPDPDKVVEQFSGSSAFFVYWGQGTRNWCVGNLEDLRTQRTVYTSVGPPWAIAVYLGKAYVADKEDAPALSPDTNWSWFAGGNFTDFDPTNVPPELRRFVDLVERRAREAANTAEKTVSQNQNSGN